MEFNFFGNGNIGDDNRAWHRYAKVKPSFSIPGTYKSKIIIKDVLSKKSVGSYDIILKKEPDQDRFGYVEIIDLFKSGARLIQTAVFNNEIWISSDAESYIEYAIYPESFNISAFDLYKLSKKEIPEVKVIFNGGFVISDLKGAGIETNEVIESFGNKPVEHFIFGENFRKSLSVISYDEISASGAYNLKVENEVKELILAISDTNTSDNMLFITMDKDSSVVKVVKKIDKEYIEDNLNEVDIKVEGTVLKFTTDGGLTYKSYDLQGPQGPPGRMPKIAVVNGSWIKWENPDGTWSDPINLMGPSPQVFLNADKTKVRFLANDVYTDWWNIEGKKGDIPLHRYVDENGIVIEDITAPGAGANGVYLNFQEPTGEWSEKKINVIGAIPDHRYLDPDGNPTEDESMAFYIQFQSPDGSWGKTVKVIGMDGLDGADGAPGPKGDMGSTPRFKIEDGSLFFENPDGTWSDPITFAAKVDKKFENGVPYIRIYNNVTGLDSDWIPLTNISIPADVKPLLHVMKTEDMYPGAQIPNGYIPRDGRILDLAEYKLFHAVLVRNDLALETDTTFTLDDVPGSFVKVTYDDVLFDLVYPEGSVKIDRTVSPVIENGTRTDTSITFDVANSSEDGAVAKIKLVEIGEIIDSTGTNTFSDLTPETTYIFEVWYPEAGTYGASNIVTHTVTTLPIPLERLVVPAVSEDSKTSTTITMTVENSIEDGAAAKIKLVETGEVVDSTGSNTFEGLTPGTTYNFEIWYPKSDTHLASSVFEYAGTTNIA